MSLKQQLKTAFKSSVLFVGTIFILSSCNKQPAADFTTDKTEYIQGETVVCTNTSLDGETFKWTFPDGQTSASTNVSYILSNTMTPGTYSIKLEAISKKGNKTSDATKSFVVKQATGKAMIWTSDGTVSQISVKIDGVSYGTITMYYKNGTPDCGANGCVNATLTKGDHTVSATDGNYSWTGTITVEKDKCNAFELK